jgi:flavin reductase (DIM6/NTAB) family NADH-FMN oxidoreductase RutF
MADDVNNEFDPIAFRRALGEYVTGVTIITAEGGNGERIGMTMNSFNSVSLDPPLVLFSVDRKALSLPALQSAKGCAVNVLSRDQQDISSRFARAQTDKWADVAWTPGYMNAPLIAGAQAHFECAPYATYDGGDHVIFVVRVVRFTTEPHNEPLAFFRGRYSVLDDGTRGAA